VVAPHLPLSVSISKDKKLLDNSKLAGALYSALKGEVCSATWINTNLPYYSIYDNGLWTTGAIPPGTSTGVYFDVYVTTGPSPGELIATWADLTTSIPYFSFYNGSTWTTTGTIPLGSSDGVYTNVVVAPGPGAGEVMAVWTNTGVHRLYYSIYSGGTWTTNILNNDSDSLAFNSIFLSAGPTPGTLIATWKSDSNSRPYYAIYSGGTWSPAALISPGGAGMFLAKFDVIPATNPRNGEIMAVWADASTSIIYYSTYSSGTWSIGAPIPMGTSVGCYYNARIAAEATGQFVVTWSNSMTQAPYFSVYDNGVWSDGAEIPPSTSVGAYQDVSIARILDTNTMIAAWGNNVLPELPYYATFVGPPVPLPPTNGQSAHIKNRFALLLEWTNQLSWTASTSLDVTGYNIKRNGVVIATNVAGTTYLDSNVPRKGTDVYLITSVNAEGTESLTGLEITVTNL